MTSLKMPGFVRPGILRFEALFQKNPEYFIPDLFI